MPSSLLTGVSGLISHQRMLDVVGNNLANMNTIGYKSRQILFTDLLYTTIRPAASASDSDVGGTNPNEVGSGTKVSQIVKDWGQGTLQQTGGTFDFAIDGNGFFVLNDGDNDVFTRQGAFALDDKGNLIDPASGFRVQRIGTLGEPDPFNPGFQTPGNASIQIPFGTSIPGEETSAITLAGNLTASASGPLEEEMTSANRLLVAGVPSTAATLLNDLDSNTVDYVAGDTIEVSGTDVDGTPVSQTLSADGTTTVGDLVAAIDGMFTGATASLDANGNIIVLADNPGEALLSMTVVDGPTNTGATTFDNHQMVHTVVGSPGDTSRSSIEVFDARGGSHVVTLTFQKQGNNTWDLTASMDPSEGVVVDGTIENIRFNDDGSLQQVLGSGILDTNLTFQFDGIVNTQTVGVSFGSNNSFDGLTQLASESTIAVEKNGFAPGVLSAINATPDGILTGVATNGRRFPLAQLAIASFKNPHGLISRGEGYFEPSLNTGQVQIGIATSGNRGAIASGQLEGSNVDIALEFTRLIVAQRGFSANARTVTVSDEVLEELTNLVR